MTTKMDLSVPQLDEEEVGAFTGRLFDYFTGGMLTYLIDIGTRTGLLEEVAAGPGTSPQIAARAGLEERYVREWLGAMVTSEIVMYDPVTATYSLPAEHAVCLTGETGGNVAPFARLNTHLARHVDAIATAFREGGGVPYERFRPEFTSVMDGLGRYAFDEHLIQTWLPLVPGVLDRVRGGARVVDVGCGTGHALNVLARAFPGSQFVGYDLADDAVAAARSEATAMGLTNVRFEVRDVTHLDPAEKFDVALVFDVIHDLVAPADVLRGIRRLVGVEGVFLMFEPRASSHLEENIGHPLAPFLYAISTLHCLTISLAHGGTGLGTAWGEQVATRMLGEAGFGQIDVLDLPDEPINALFVARS